MINFFFFFVCLCSISIDQRQQPFVASIDSLSTVQRIVHDTMAYEDGKHNISQKGYQYLAERILTRLLVHYQQIHNFAVFVSSSDKGIRYLTDQTAYTYREKWFTLVNADFNVGRDGQQQNVYSKTDRDECLANLTILFQSCDPENDDCIPILVELCGDNYYESLTKFGVFVFLRPSAVGIASNLPSEAFLEQLLEFKGSKAKNSRWWRAFIVLIQDHLNGEAAESGLFKASANKLTSIKSLANDKLVTVQDNENGTLAAVSNSPSHLGQFLLVDNGDSTVSLWASAIGKWVAVELAHGTAELVARSETIGKWEKFELLENIDSSKKQHLHRLRARANRKLVSVNKDGILVASGESSGNEPNITFEFSSIGSQFEHLITFPNEDGKTEGGSVRITYALLTLASFLFLLLFLALSAMSFYVCLLHRFDTIRGGLSLQMHAAFWFRKGGLDRILDSTAIDNECLLYSGPNSRVYLARYRFAVDGVREVAVKVPSKEAFRMDMIMEETRINAQLRHGRIVEYIGFYRDAFNDMRIVCEFMAGGDLHSHLADRKNLLTVGHLFNFMGQIVEGMQYLANRRIIHRDLAARNCMLTADCTTIKIADFGLSRYFNLDDKYTCSSPVRLPVRWTAIECLGTNAEILPNSKFSEKSDIWSFGIVLWECFTRGEMPYGGEEVSDVLGRLRAGWRLPRPGPCPAALYEIVMLKCWAAVPELRPDFAAVSQLQEQVFDHLVEEMPETIANEV